MGRAIKEATASSFVFRSCSDGWRLGLIWHPRLNCFMLPGGHVENFETSAEAAVRENQEETGWATRLVPGPSAAVPDGAPHPVVPAPWWVQDTPRLGSVASSARSLGGVERSLLCTAERVRVAFGCPSSGHPYKLGATPQLL